jgi:hypothetical protein
VLLVLFINALYLCCLCSYVPWFCVWASSNVFGDVLAGHHKWFWLLVTQWLFNSLNATQGWERFGEQNDWAFAGLDFVLKSDEWARPGGCKDDAFTFSFNGKEFLARSLPLPYAL